MTRTFAAFSVLLCALTATRSVAQSDSALLASKSIGQVHAVQNRVFAFSDDGTSYSALDLFGAQPVVVTREWQWLGGAEGGAPWGSSLLLRANYCASAQCISDTLRVARVTSLRYAGTFRGGDSLLFVDRGSSDTAAGLADGARLTALAVRDSAGTAEAALGFGRLGVAYARLAPENSNQLFVEPDGEPDSVLSFLAFPTGSDTALALYSCRWNALCEVDTLSGVPPLDSVIALAVDSSAPDSAWLLVATSRGLRRGLWGGTFFPRVTLPGTDTAGEPVRSVFTSPARSLAWAFTGSRFFFSDDHGASFRVPPDMSPDVQISPADLTFSSDRPPHAAFRGDTTFINFNFDFPGLVLFRRDTILANNGAGLGEVLLDTADGLAISRSEGSLTRLAVAQGSIPSQAVLVVGTTLKGVFHKRLDVPGSPFLNINRQTSLKGGLGEVITYPTLISTGTRCGDQYSRIGYRLSKDGRVTITVYNYAMEKVKTIVRNARRTTVAGRSENLSEDRWDGCDEGGRFVSVGTYYVLVESDKGEKAFGKILVTRGRR